MIVRTLAWEIQSNQILIHETKKQYVSKFKLFRLIHVTIEYKRNIPIQTSSREVYQQEHLMAIWELNMPPNTTNHYE
jgi:hypothetical protein